MGRRRPRRDAVRRRPGAAVRRGRRRPLAQRHRAGPGAREPPRIGERGGAQSRREQSGVDPAAGDTASRLAAGNAAYEERFGRVFLIRAAGRDAEAILGELERRMRNDDEAERAETVDNLRQIALLRLEELIS
nr:2-oxo-4-hydroxy-4-carboxy-5-ureidoimidazoline decarboxylase [Nocardioides humi]